MKYTICLAAALLALPGCGGKGHDHRPAPPPRPVDPVHPVKKTYAVWGRVQNAATGAPLAGARVTAQRGDGSPILGQCETEANGSFRIPDLPYGVPLVVACQPALGPDAYGLAVSEPYDLEEPTEGPQWVLPPLTLGCPPVHATGTLAVTTHGGKGSLLEPKLLKDGSTRTLIIRTLAPGADGVIRMEHLPPGHYEFRLDSPAWTSTVTVRAGETTSLQVPAAVH